ncbi:hypothetical protein Bp8pS_135 [Bacillus phage vB_BpuM-BpSp]|nr:hypothetical protein Bp8pS_135 [Bacillus phage vB_BpuM-BpSp]
MGIEYSSIESSKSSFKQPRQKIWGVFTRPKSTNAGDTWELVKMSNDIEEAKEAVREWLNNPPTTQGVKTGLDNVILCEIAPISSRIEV